MRAEYACGAIWASADHRRSTLATERLGFTRGASSRVKQRIAVMAAHTDRCGVATHRAGSLRTSAEVSTARAGSLDFEEASTRSPGRLAFAARNGLSEGVAISSASIDQFMRPDGS